MNEKHGVIILDDERPHLIEDHDYDGIKELSRPMPAWLTAIFFFTVSCGTIYMIHMGSGSGIDPHSELAARMNAIDQMRQNEVAASAPTPMDPAAELKLGHELFAGKCAVCHGQKGEGGIGPNLTDEYWLHGDGVLSDIESIVKTGVPEKGMPPWINMMKPGEIAAVTAYVNSIVGTDVAGKAPEGRKVAKK